MSSKAKGVVVGVVLGVALTHLYMRSQESKPQVRPA